MVNSAACQWIAFLRCAQADSPQLEGTKPLVLRATLEAAALTARLHISR